MKVWDGYCKRDNCRGRLFIEEGEYGIYKKCLMCSRFFDLEGEEVRPMFIKKDRKLKGKALR